MHSTFTVFGIDFPAYYTFLMVGYTIVVMLAHREALKTGIDGNSFLDLALVLLLAGLIGARLLHVAADGYLDDYIHLCTDPYQVEGKFLPDAHKCTSDLECVAADRGELCHPEAGTCHQGRDCFRAFKFWYGGLAYYGGLGLAIPIGIWFMRRRKMSLWRVGDLAGWGIALGLAFGRTGCFFAGCCFGQVCQGDGAACLVFPAGSPAWDRHIELGLISRTAVESLPVVPTQVIEGGFSFLIFLFLYFVMRPRKKFHGELFFWYAILYAIGRFMVEFWRDDARGEILGISTSQALGIPLLIFGIVMLVKGYRGVGRQAVRATTDSGTDSAFDKENNDIQTPGPLN